MINVVGGKFANGAATAAFASLVASAASSASDGRGVNGGNRARDKELLRDDNLGPAHVRNDGKVHVAKHGGDPLTADEVVKVDASLDRLFAEERGQAALNKLSAENPLEIRLNNEGVNIGGEINKQFRISVDINSNFGFQDMANNGVPTPVSLDRLFSHEINESVFRGFLFDHNNVIKNTDLWLQNIEGTVRGSEHNFCQTPACN